MANFLTWDEGVLERFKNDLPKNTRFFDVLVAYFRASGFLEIFEELKNIEKIRILVGMNADKAITDILVDEQENLFSRQISTEDKVSYYLEQVKRQVSNDEDSAKVEQGLKCFLDYIQSGKLSIKIYPEASIHAKVYILRKDEDKSSIKGIVITGSSNLSFSGLKGNLEFNVELRDDTDVDYAVKKFELLWDKSVDITERYKEVIKENTWIKDDITPYELYLKFLYEYFKDELKTEDESSPSDLPDGFLSLKYQDDAVNQALRILNEHNGLFLSDVVGLGKTYVTALIMKRSPKKERFMVICPPNLMKYWEETLFQFNLPGKVKSSGGLEKIYEEERLDKIDCIIVDEAHNFRNSDTQGYNYLHKICAGKKVILISATPQNNKINDLASQIYLFQPKYNSSIPEKNLASFFKKLEKDLEFEKDASSELIKTVTREVAQQLRDRVLRHIMIRRTRKDIKKHYGEEIAKQGLRFPDLPEQGPDEVYYEFDKPTDALFEKTISKINKLTLSRYTPTRNLKDHIKQEDEGLVIGRELNLMGFMRSLLVKRLESSFFSFKATIERLMHSYQDFITMFNEGEVLIIKGEDATELLNNLQNAELNEDEDIILTIEETIEKKKGKRFKKTDFKDDYEAKLQNDLQILTELHSNWKEVTTDPKFDKFLIELQTNPILKNNKIIVFSEAKDTVNYLEKRLNAIAEFKGFFLAVHGGSSQEQILEVAHNFDPNVQDKHKKDAKRIVITTDVLSEGKNLHRANVVVNYDLPWNPTRVIQRIGRINRVGTKHETIHVFNFFPTAKSDDVINFKQNTFKKIQAFHNILGSDERILTQGEVTDTHEFFEKLRSKSFLQGEDDSDASGYLDYLAEIRLVKNENQPLFNKIEKLPLKCRTSRKVDDDKKGLLTFFKQGNLQKFVYCDSKKTTKDLTFDDAIQYLKATPTTSKEPLPRDYFDMLTVNKRGFAEYVATSDATIMSIKGKNNEKDVLQYVMFLVRNASQFSIDEKEYIQNVEILLKDGRIGQRAINNTSRILKKIPKDKVNNLQFQLNLIKEEITEEYLDNLSKTKKQREKHTRDIILSEALV